MTQTHIVANIFIDRSQYRVFTALHTVSVCTSAPKINPALVICNAVLSLDDFCPKHEEEQVRARLCFFSCFFIFRDTHLIVPVRAAGT